MEYLGGTGVGGGTLVGLAKRLLQIETPEHLDLLAKDGDLSRVDLRIGDFARTAPLETMSKDLTASNFGKVSDMATKEDLALGIFNMVYETIGMVAVFAARARNIQNIVLTGNLTSLAPICAVFQGLETNFGVHFIVPEMSRFGTVIGAALCEEEAMI